MSSARDSRCSWASATSIELDNAPSAPARPPLRATRIPNRMPRDASPDGQPRRPGCSASPLREQPFLGGSTRSRALRVAAEPTRPVSEPSVYCTIHDRDEAAEQRGGPECHTPHESRASASCSRCREASRGRERVSNLSPGVSPSTWTTSVQRFPSFRESDRDWPRAWMSRDRRSFRDFEEACRADTAGHRVGASRYGVHQRHICRWKIGDRMSNLCGDAFSARTL